MRNIRIILSLVAFLAVSGAYAQASQTPKARIVYQKNQADPSFTYGQNQFSDSTLLDLKILLGPLDSLAHQSFIINAYDYSQSSMLTDTVEMNQFSFHSGKRFFVKTYDSLTFKIDHGYLLLFNQNQTLTDSLNLP